MATKKADLVAITVNRVAYCKAGMHPMARIALYKSAAGPVLERLAKSLETERGAQLFDALLAEEERERTYWKSTEAVSTPLSAFSQSIRSIVGDARIDPATRSTMIRASIEQFATAIPDLEPITKALDDIDSLGEESTRDHLVAMLATKRASTGSQPGATPMPKTDAEIAELEKKAADAETLRKSLAAEEAKTANLALLAKMTDAEKVFTAKMSDEDKAKFMAESEDERKAKVSKSAATDETLVIAGAEIRKSQVGDAQFAIFKSLARENADTNAKLAKAISDAEDTRLAKRATEEFSHLPGKPEEIAAVLKSFGSMPEAQRIQAETMLKAGDAALAGSFARTGRGSTEPSPLAKAAGAAFDEKVSMIKSRDNCSGTEAMTKARREFPAEYAAYNGESDSETLH